jgi:hypothetical protein
MPYFDSPVLNRKAGRAHELWWVSINIGKTVVKVGGEWRTVVSPTEDFLATCDVVLRGGYKTYVSTELAAELTAAGFGDNIVES